MFFQKRDLDQDFDQETDLPEKTGMSRFWELIKDELASVLIANVLFLVTCIPIVTIPPALLSLHTIMRKIILGKKVSCARDYFTAFKCSWKRAYGAFFLTALPLGFAGYGAAFYLRHAAEIPVLLAPFALCVCVFLVDMLASAYLYGLLSSGQLLKDVVKSALILGVARPLRAALASLCYYGATLLAVLYFPFSGAYLALLGFSLPCLLGNFYIRTVLTQYCDE